jgi:signal transduction histidine kinase
MDDLYVADTELPDAVRAVGSLLTAAIVATAVLVVVLAGSPAEAGWLSPVLLALAGVPWIVEAVRPFRSRLLFCSWALGPIAVVAVNAWLTDADLGSSLAYQLLEFPVLVLAVVQAFFSPRRALLLSVGSAYAVLLLLSLLSASSHSDFDVAGVVITQLAFCFAVGGAVAVRYAAIATSRARQAREELARQVVAEQRRRVAQDVHDVIAHTLSVTMLHITAARLALDASSPEQAKEALAEAERHGRSSLADIRRIIRLLRLDDTTTADAVQPGVEDIPGLVEGFRSAGLPVDVSVSGETARVPPLTALAIYRVAQEGLTNASRHGEGPAVMRLQVLDDEVLLEIRNQRGTRAEATSRGSGLVGMRERVAAAGGSLEVGPECERWTVRASLPLAATTATEEVG